MSTAAWAEAAPETKSETAAKSEDMVTTGVARGRDRLDSATSTSSLKASEIAKIAPRSFGEIFRSIPGMRAEAPGGEGNASLTIRGLPLAQGGAKFLQLQEDGLPTLEFGDIAFATADTFLRADLNMAQIESIRGGSASTFASNSPGGIINLISKTGDVEGGAIQATAGIDYEEYRTDFDYGAKLSDTLRFHVGGFYRVGEGPRQVGYDGFKGGQLKFNITKEFTGGYIRFYGKYLDDRSPYYGTVPVRVTGTNSNPTYQALPNFDPRSDTLYSSNFRSNLTLGGENTVERHQVDGMRAKVKSFGVETQFEVNDWTITEKFRYSKISGSAFVPAALSALSPAVDTAGAVATALGGAGATITYATGPNIGTAVPTGNLVVKLTNEDTQLRNLDYVVNDLRASRVWELGQGDLTTTVGFYKSSQNIDSVWNWTSTLMEVAGGGNANLVNVTTAGGTPVTQNGYYSYGSSFIFGARRSLYDLTYGVNAPYASVNYHVGKVSVGGSIRYDYGTARGQVIGSDILSVGARNVSRDINGDGVISDAETRVGYLPLSSPIPINYNYHYVSYSTGVNYRVADPFALFARYSRGARANSDRIMFSNYVSNTTGGLARPDAAYDPVQQAEIGAKWRKSGVTLNLTGFWAKTREHNISLDRGYRAYGLEFEGGIRKGPWSMTASATYTKAEITADALDASTLGHSPKHQPDLIFQAMPQFSTENFSIGASIIGTTASYTTDANQLKLPGFTTVGAFVQYRPTERVLLSLNSNNLFNVKGYIAADQNNIPASNIVTAQAINGRTVSTSVRFDF
ncbi:MAG: TonB-dependent receptor [Sphingobium sp.]